MEAGSVQRPSSAVRQAATTCLLRLRDKTLVQRCGRLSPRAAMRAAAAVLAPEDIRRSAAWVVQGAEPEQGGWDGLEGIHGAPAAQVGVWPGTGHVSAWPLWFRETRAQAQKPLLYMLHSSSLAGLHAALDESRQRGVFFNEAEIRASAWPKSVQPALPLWLSSSMAGVPYDPASGAEVLAMLRVALRWVYVDGKADFVYFSMHDDAIASAALPWRQAWQAFKGMYRLSGPLPPHTAGVRLLGAGRTLGAVRQAAALLADDWGVASEVWSCPSYTRLARDGHAAECWNLLHPRARPKSAHIHECLAGSRMPVIAVTGYSHFIAAQIGAFVPGRFQALGADSLRTAGEGAGTALAARWIVVKALMSLVADGFLPPVVTQQALQRYQPGQSD